MSNKTFGDSKLKGPVPVIGKPAVTVYIDPIEIQSRLNRRTNQKDIDKYLKDGFQEALWKNPSVAQLPDGRKFLFDGDHRRHMWIRCKPGQMMPVDIVHADSEAQLADICVKVNLSNRKDINPEEAFVWNCLRVDEDAVKYAGYMKNAGLRISLGTGESGDTVGDVNGPSVKIVGFKKAIDNTSPAATAKSANLVKQSWPRDIIEAKDGLKTELLQALAAIYEYTDFLDEGANHKAGGTRDKFEKWFTQCAQLVWGRQVNAIKNFKHEGSQSVSANVHTEKSMWAVALGILSTAKTSGSVASSNGAWNKHFNPAIKAFKAKLENDK
jgi:hypothetical protein